MEIIFIATVKNLNSKNLVSGDRSYRVLLEGRDERVMRLDKVAPYKDLTFKVDIANNPPPTK